MKLCVITYMYPGRHNSSDFVFVKQLVDACASYGHHVTVVCPYNVIHYRRCAPSKEYYTMGKGDVTVFRPWYLSLATIHFGNFYFSSWFYHRAQKRAFKKMPIPDVLYGHFWSTAFSGYEYAKQHSLPLFVASGESEIDFRLTDKTRDFCQYVSGVICVSSKNRDESVALNLTDEQKCLVAPNAINNKLFRKLDKKACREKLGFTDDAFIIAFVGWFNERKGAARVAKAIEMIDGEPIYSIFVGKPYPPGVEVPDCNNILFKGALKHDSIPEYLCAADVFVLPTRHEGCCNAIIEALACGLPVISSDLSFNKDVLNETNSILINPDSVEDISKAIRMLRDDKELLKRLSEGALEMAKKLTIDERANTILDFIVNHSNNLLKANK